MSSLSIADAALTSLTDITQRATELAAQSANGVYSNGQRSAMQTEMTALTNEYNRIVRSTKFNGRTLLDSDNNGGAISIQVGYGPDSSLSLTLGDKLKHLENSGLFSPSTPMAAQGTLTMGVAAADVDHDGKLDLATGGMTSAGEVRISRGDGTGAFTAGATYAAEGFITNSVALADLNNDGYADLITAGMGATGELSVRLNDKSGNFLGKQTLTRGGNLLSAAVGDINGDGRMEIVAAGDSGSGTGMVAIFNNNGAGVFSAGATYTPTGQYQTNAVQLGDMNGDGSLDIVAAGIGDVGQVNVLFNNGSGVFTNPAGIGMESQSSNSVAVGDVNGDGALDIVTAGIATDGITQWGAASVRLNNGSGSFGAAASYAQEGYETRAVSLADVNSDGLLDLVSAGQATASGGGQTSVRLGAGGGAFGGLTAYATHDDSSTALVAADFKGAGVSQLITGGNGSSGGSAVLMSTEVSNVTTVLNLNISTQASARQALDKLSGRLDAINNERGSIGSFMSRIEVTLSNLSSMRENIDSAASRIVDADVAAEVSEAQRNTILQQCGAAVLAQASLQPRIALALLQ